MLVPHYSLHFSVVVFTLWDVVRLFSLSLVDAQCCHCDSVRPQPQLLGQLPIENIMPGHVFDKVGMDYAGPVYIKHGFVCKPTIVKAYICVFVSLSVKAVHLE